MVRDGRDGEIGARRLLSDKRRQREGGTGEMRHGWGQAGIVSWGDFQFRSIRLSWTTGSIPRAIPRFGILNCANTLKRLGGSKFLHYSCKKWLNWSSLRVTECLNCGAPSRSDNAVFLCRAPPPAPAPHLSFGSGQSSRVIRGTRDHLRSSSAILGAHLKLLLH